MTDHLVHLHREMLRIRRFEERCVELYSASKIRGFLHLCIGEEAVAVGVMAALEPADRVASTYREHGHAIARGTPMRSVMAEMFGKMEGCSRGRGGSMHLFDTSVGLFGGNAIVAGGLPLAIGMGLGDRLTGRPLVNVALFGDGALAEGEFHETMNLAALWHLPVLFACENNRYAMGTALSKTHAETDLTRRAATYGMPAERVDGMDVEAVEEATRRAVVAIRAGEGPRFVEFLTYRFRAHSMYDPDRYREASEIEQWRARDPITTLAGRLVDHGLLDDGSLAELEAEIGHEIDEAIAFAEAGTMEPVADLHRFVVTEGLA